MHELDDHALLRQYAEQNSEAAFAALVARHVDKVYSAALRHTRNVHAAEEITQAVFVILAKKSGRLGAKVILAGWLYETARLTAVTFIRSEIRRARREQEAHMQTVLNENDSAAWPHIAPLLDDALAGLSAADRHAVVLRYFDGKSLGEVGAALGASEDAAKKRVTRAVEKLRGYFTKRGVTLTATVLTAAISANSVQAAPLGLAATVMVTAAKGTLISAAITTLVNTTMKTMTWLKLKLAVGVSVAALLAGGAATVAVSQHRADGVTSAEAEALLKRVAETYRSMESYSDEGVTFNGFVTNTFTIKLGRYDSGIGEYYRIEWKARAVSPHAADGVVWSAGQEHSRVFWNPDPRVVNNPGHKDKLLTKAAGTIPNLYAMGNMSGGATWTIPPLFFGAGKDSGAGFISLGIGYALTGEEQVDGVPCTMVAGHLKSYPDLPVRLWIGKDDLLIRKTERVTMESTSALKKDSPEMKKLLDEWSRAKTDKAKAAIEEKIQMAGAIHSYKTRKPMVHTETHENIKLNQSLTPLDFAR